MLQIDSLELLLQLVEIEVPDRRLDNADHRANLGDVLIPEVSDQVGDGHYVSGYQEN